MVSLADLLDPGPALPEPVVTPARVGGPAAWADLVRQGAVDLLHEQAGVPAGALVTPAHRALALAPTLPRRCVLAGRTAAWVLTGLHRGAPAPALPVEAGVEVAYCAGTHAPSPRAALTARQAPRLVRDTVRLAGVPVTTPARTAIDVACTVPHDEAVAVLVALARSGTDLVAAGRALELRGRVVGRPAARRALAAASAVLDR